WAHNGMLELETEKMSKSVGNIVSLREALDTWGREALLVFFLGAHYRSPIAYAEDALAQAATVAEEFRTAFRVAAARAEAPLWADFAAALDDDFNTQEALAVLHEWRKAGQLELLERGLHVFGLHVGPSPEPPADVARLAEERRGARARREFAEADRLRDEIASQGWEVQDVPDGFRLVPLSCPASSCTGGGLSGGPSATDAGRCSS